MDDVLSETCFVFLKKYRKMNFKSIVWFIKAINIYIYIFFCFVLFCFVLFCFVLFCSVLFCFVCFVLVLFVCFCLVFVFVVGTIIFFFNLLWGLIRPTTEEWFPTRVQLSSVRLPFCKVT